MNFYESHSHIWFLCRSYSIYFFTNYKNRELKITKKSFLISSIPVITFLISIVLAIKFIKFENSDIESYGDSTSILFIVSMFGILAQHFNSFVIVISSINHRNDILALYNKLYELDNHLINKLNIQFEYKNLKKNTLKILILICVPYILLTCVINYIYITTFSFIPLSIIFNFINGVEIISSVEYFYWTKIIKYRFNSVNNALIEIIGTSKIVPFQLESMIKSHLLINCLITDVNKIYGLIKLSSIGNDFFLFLAQFYAFFISIDNRESILSYSNSKYLIGLLSLPFVIGKQIATVNGCQKALKAQNNFGKLIKTLESNKEVSDLVNFFGLYELHTDVRFTAFNFFSIDFTLLFAVSIELYFN